MDNNNLIAGGEIIPSTLENNQAEIETYKDRAEDALKLIDDLVLKNYLSSLSQMDIIPMDIEFINKGNIVIYKINKMVYEKDEYATDKFVSIVGAMTFTNCSIYLIVDGKDDGADFYLGIKCNDNNRTSRSIAYTFENSIKGQFPGILMTDISRVNKGENNSAQDRLLEKFSNPNTISSCVGVPAYKNSKGEYTNQNFIQGIEKFAVAMQGKRYTAIILASSMTSSQVSGIRIGYENVYSELSTMATQQISYNSSESLSNAISRTKGTNTSFNRTKSQGTSISTNKSDGETKANVGGKIAGLGGAVMSAGSILTATGAGAPIGLMVAAAGAAALAIGTIGAKQKSKTSGTSEGTTETQSDSLSFGEQNSLTNSDTSGISASKTFTLTVKNKHIEEVAKRIDKQLERISVCESTGLWSAGAYFLSYNNDRATAEIGATIFRSIMQGEQSGVETSAINTWYGKGDNTQKLSTYISNFTHPVFKYNNIDSRPLKTTQPPPFQQISRQNPLQNLQDLLSLRCKPCRFCI